MLCAPPLSVCLPPAECGASNRPALRGRNACLSTLGRHACALLPKLLTVVAAEPCVGSDTCCCPLLLPGVLRLRLCTLLRIDSGATLVASTPLGGSGSCVLERRRSNVRSCPDAPTMLWLEEEGGGCVLKRSPGAAAAAAAEGSANGEVG